MKQVKPTYKTSYAEGRALANVLLAQNKTDFTIALSLLSLSSFAFVASLYFYPLQFKILWGLLSLSGVAFLLHGINNFKIENNKAYQQVVYQPHKVVWIYYQVTQIMPFGILVFKKYRLFINTENGETYDISLNASDIHPLFAYLKSQCPEATFGHNVANEQLFRANPLLLKR